MYGTKPFADWVGDVLPSLSSTRKLDVTPAEQFDDMMLAFCLGEELIVGPQFHVLHPRKAAVWELKTPDLRVFGWFPQKDNFIAVAGHHTDGVKEHGLYAGFVGEVVRVRNGLDLDEPKFIAGEDPNDVVSNCCLP